MRQYVLVLCLVLPLVAKSQSITNDKQQDLLGKGHISVGVSVGQGFRGTYPTTTYVVPRVQYFIANGWSVSADLRYLTSNVYPQTVDKPDYRLWGGGLSTRYYVVRGKRLAVFTHLGASYGQSIFRMKADAPATRSQSWQTELGIGAHYRLSKRFSVEAMAGRSWLSNETVSAPTFLPPADFNRWQFSVGISYQLR